MKKMPNVNYLKLMYNSLTEQLETIQDLKAMPCTQDEITRLSEIESKHSKERMEIRTQLFAAGERSFKIQTGS